MMEPTSVGRAENITSRPENAACRISFPATMDELSDLLNIKEQQLTEKEKELNKLQFQNHVLRSRNTVLENAFKSINQSMETTKAEILKVNSLKSYRIAYLFTRIKNEFIAGDRKQKQVFLHWAITRFKHQEEQDHTYNPLYRITDIITEAKPHVDDEFLKLQQDYAITALKESRRMDVLCTKHTLFVGHLMCDNLRKFGIQSEVHLPEENTEYDVLPYMVICPQMMKSLPDLYLSFQMEQFVSTHWMTDEYIEILENSFAVFDYSEANLEIFYQNERIKNKLYYCPISYNREQINTQSGNREETPYDVVFYGAVNSPRRERILGELKKKFNIRIIEDLFGEELYAELKKAKIVVNIHYYENALLETTRLYEILTLGTSVVVSERSADQRADEQIEPFVDFVDTDDVNGIISHIEYWLTHDQERAEKIRINRDKMSQNNGTTTYYVGRFLLANDVISFDDFYDLIKDDIRIGEKVCLGLPETQLRRRDFLKGKQYGFKMFDGLKHRQGWIGCAMSYKFIMKKALDEGLERVMICEDDVDFPENFGDLLNTALAYLDRIRNWDIFSGFMADVGDVEVLQYEKEETIDFITLNKMISTVFNIYNNRIFGTIANWDERNRDVYTNTIDRYLENHSLRIVTTYPFLVGHKEQMQSTIWGTKNDVYNEMIDRSNRKMQQLIGLRKAELMNQPENAEESDSIGE